VNSVFIFQIGSALTTATNSQVKLQGGAQAANIFWQVGSSATLGTYSIFNGTILAQVSISLATGAALNGRALARTGAVTLDTNTGVNPGPPTTGGPPATLAVTCPLNTAQVGVAYNSVLVATGGTPPYHVFNHRIAAAGFGPETLPLEAVTGTPTGIGSIDAFSANALDAIADTATRGCVITTTAAGLPPPGLPLRLQCFSCGRSCMRRTLQRERADTAALEKDLKYGLSHGVPEGGDPRPRARPRGSGPRPGRPA